MHTLPLVLGSSSPTRLAQLTELGIPFTQASPDLDEQILDGESGPDLVTRLSIAKAQGLAEQFPAHLIIGGDTIAVLNGQLIGKPKTVERCTAILKEASGGIIQYYAGLCLYNSQTGRIQTSVDPITVHLRTLTDATIAYYIEHCDPLNCAGGLRSEGLGSALIKRIDNTDPSALLGLPLFALTNMLINENAAPMAG